GLGDIARHERVGSDRRCHRHFDALALETPWPEALDLVPGPHLRGLTAPIVGDRLGYPDGVFEGSVPQEVTEAATARHGAQPQLALAGFAPQDLQHLLRVGAGQPLLFRHGVTPCPRSGPRPKNPGTRHGVISPAPSPSARTTPASPASAHRRSSSTCATFR